MKIEELKAKKQELGYSYKQIAELSGLPVGTVQKVLGGITKSPRFDTLCALEQALFGQRRDLGEPTCIHQLLAGKLFKILDNFIEKNKGRCIAAISPMDVQLDCDKKTMVQPDVLVVCDRRKFQKGRVFGAPDLIIEILSPLNTWKDRSVKMMKYCRAGVREYWMIDPERKKVLVYDMQTEEFPAIYGFEHEVPVKIFDGKCKISFPELYEHVRFLYEPEILDEEGQEE